MRSKYQNYHHASPPAPGGGGAGRQAGVIHAAQGMGGKARQIKLGRHGDCVEI